MVVTDITADSGAESAPSASAPAPDRPLRVGILGSGFMGKVHAKAARAAGADVVAAAGSTPGRAAHAAAAVGARRGYPDLAAMLSDDAVDVVHICTPNDSHADLAWAVLRAGVHVVCEKPLTTDAESAHALASAAVSSGLVATVPFVYRFHPMARELRARVQAGAPGQSGRRARALSAGLAVSALGDQLAGVRPGRRTLSGLRRHRFALV